MNCALATARRFPCSCSAQKQSRIPNGYVLEIRTETSYHLRIRRWRLRLGGVRVPAGRNSAPLKQGGPMDVIIAATISAVGGIIATIIATRRRGSGDDAQ
ncbi:hypothetical protein GCM10017687_67610 [Streptomyces echinatus]